MNHQLSKVTIANVFLSVFLFHCTPGNLDVESPVGGRDSANQGGTLDAEPYVPTEWSAHVLVGEQTQNPLDTFIAPSDVCVGPQGSPFEGSLFVADTHQDRVYQIDAEGQLFLVAGNGDQGFSGDGDLATLAQLNEPLSLAFDDDFNLYIADSGNHRIRKVWMNPQTLVEQLDTIETVVGSGEIGLDPNCPIGTDEPPAPLPQPTPLLDTLLYRPLGLTFHQGVLYFSDWGHHRVVKVDFTQDNSQVLTIAGNGCEPPIEPIGPPGAEGEVNHHIDIEYGDGGPAERAYLVRPQGLAFDHNGDLLIVERGRGRIARVVFSENGNRATMYSQLIRADLDLNAEDSPHFEAAPNHTLYRRDSQGLHDIVVDPNDDGQSSTIYVSDDYGHVVFKVVDQQGVETERVIGVYPSQGLGREGIHVDQAQLNFPQGLAVDAEDNLLIADQNNRRVRRVRLGSASETEELDRVYTIMGKSDRGWHDKPATAVRFESVWGLVFDERGHLLFSDEVGDMIHKVSPDSERGWDHAKVNTLIGAEPLLGNPADTESLARAGLNQPRGMVFDAQGDLYISDISNQCIRKATLSEQTPHVVRVAGTCRPRNGNCPQLGDGEPALNDNVCLDRPLDVALDEAGNLYTTDYGNDRIRKIIMDPQTGEPGLISTIAGGGAIGNINDEPVPGFQTDEYNPLGITFNRRENALCFSNTISNGLITGGDDSVNTALHNRIRRIDLEQQCETIVDEPDEVPEMVAGCVQTVAGGHDSTHAWLDGLTARQMKFYYPRKPVFDEQNNLWIADGRQYRILQMILEENHHNVLGASQLGHVYQRIGSGREGFWGDGALGRNAEVGQLFSIAFDTSWNLFLSSMLHPSNLGNIQASTIRKVDRETEEITTVAGYVDPVDIDSFPRARVIGGRSLIQIGNDYLVSGGNSGRIFRMDSSTREVEVVAGYPNGFEEGQDPFVGLRNSVRARYAALLKNASAMVYDAERHTVYFTERDAHVIRALHAWPQTDPSQWSLSTLTGHRDEPGFADGNLREAQFNEPTGLAFDAELRVLYVADTANHLIRRIDLDEQQVLTLAGQIGQANRANENEFPNFLSNPMTLGLDREGHLWVWDSGNYQLKRITGLRTHTPRVTARIQTIMGTVFPNVAAVQENTTANSLPLRDVGDLAFSAQGEVLVTSEDRILRIQPLSLSANDNGQLVGHVEPNSQVDELYRCGADSSPQSMSPNSHPCKLTGIALTNTEQWLVLDAYQGSVIELRRQR